MRRALILLVVLIFLSTVMLAAAPSRAESFSEVFTGRGVRYTTHDPIVIQNNSDFDQQAADEGWPGDGSATDPYIIAGYEIFYEEEEEPLFSESVGSMEFGDSPGTIGIHIGNTTVHFIIKDNHIYNETYAAILLTNVTNGSVEGNLIEQNKNGVILDSASTGNFVVNNTFKSQVDNNVEVDGPRNFVMDNMCVGGDVGIYIMGTNNTVKNNTLENSGTGIGVGGRHTNVYENKMNHTGIFLFVGDKVPDREGFSLQNISTNNTVDGKPVYYIKDVGHTTVPVDAGEVIAVNVSYVDMDNLKINNSTVAIELMYSNNVSINHGTFRWNNEYSIFAGFTEYVRIENSTMDDGELNVYQSNHCIIRNNEIMNELDGNGLGIYDVDYVMIEHNDVYNNEFAINGDGNHYVIAHNRIWNHTNYGVYLSGEDMQVHNNTIANSHTGLTMDSLDYSVIENNTISENNYRGIYIYTGQHNIIRYNLIINNTDYGIYINNGVDNTIYNNSFYYNNGSNDTYDSEHIQAYDSGYHHNYWNNSAYGNYWHDWANNNNTNDGDNDGIVDWPYSIDGGSNVYDHYPLKEPEVVIPELPSMLFIVLIVAFVALLGRKIK